MLKEKTWTRAWLAGFLLVAVLGHVEAQGTDTLVTINEILSSKQDAKISLSICYVGLQSSSVSRSEITAFNRDGTTLYETEVESTSDIEPCSTFPIEANLSSFVSTELRLELRLFSEDDTLIGKGSIDFTMPDISDYSADCTQSYSVGDKKMLQLVCSSVPKETDKFMMDQNLDTYVLVSPSSSHPAPFLLLSDEITGGNVKVYRDLSVTVNDADTTTDIPLTYNTFPIQDASTASSTVSTLTLAYDPMTISAEGTFNSDTKQYDVVYYWKEAVETDPQYISVCPNSIINNKLSCQISGYSQGTSAVNVVLIGYSVDNPTTVLESGLYTVQDYNIEGRFITSKTAEWNWNRAPVSELEYEATLGFPSGTTPPYNTAMVTCIESDPLCYVYFPELDENLEYTVTIQRKENGDLNRVTSGKVSSSEKITLLRKASQMTGVSDLRIQDIHLHWRSDSLTVDAGVCFHGEATGLTQYQLVLVDAVGRWRRVQGASHTTTEGRMCFSGVTLDSRQFNTTDKVAVLVIKRDVDGRTVLASTESHVFFISPKVEVVSGHAGLVSWGNPGGYTVSTRKESHPASVTAPTTGKLRHYFVPRKTEDRLLVEAEASGVKMTALVPLTGTAAAGM